MARPSSRPFASAALCEALMDFEGVFLTTFFTAMTHCATGVYSAHRMTQTRSLRWCTPTALDTMGSTSRGAEGPDPVTLRQPAHGHRWFQSGSMRRYHVRC